MVFDFSDPKCASKAWRARDQQIDFDWQMTVEELVAIRRFAYHWGTAVRGRFRDFHAHMTTAITTALADHHTPYILGSSPSKSFSVTCRPDDGHFRLSGYLPLSNLVGYATGALLELRAAKRLPLGPAAREKILSAMGELGLDVEALCSPENQVVLNALYGLKADHGVPSGDVSQTQHDERQLAFQGPFGVSAAEDVRAMFSTPRDPIVKKCGIYVWTLKSNNTEYVHYVGQTRISFEYRQAQHVEKILCGQYNTYDPDAIAIGEVRRVAPVRSAWPDSIPAFLESYEDAASKRRRYVQMLRFYMAELPHEDDLLNRVEGALGRHFLESDDEMVYRFLGARFKVPARRTNATTRFNLDVENKRQIVAMPRSVIA